MKLKTIMKKALTWDDLANIYDKETGGTARIKTMASIAAWAVKRKDLFNVETDGSFTLKVTEVEKECNRLDDLQEEMDSFSL